VLDPFSFQEIYSGVHTTSVFVLDVFADFFLVYFRIQWLKCIANLAWSEYSDHSDRRAVMTFRCWQDFSISSPRTSNVHLN